MLDPNPEGISLTIAAIEKRTTKLQQLYKKRQKKREGCRPNKGTFIFFAAYSLFKEKYPERKRIFDDKLPEEWNLRHWLEKNFEQYYKNNEKAFAYEKLYKWMTGKPFKEMQWEGAWDDLKITYEISHKNAGKKEMSQRKIQRKHSISKQDLENLTGFILSVHSGNKKISNKFIFDRPA